MVAPNSPMARAKERMAPATMPGAIKGKVMVANTQSGLAPRVAPACSSRLSTASIERRMARTMSGNPMIPAAKAAPVQRKAKTRPR